MHSFTDLAGQFENRFSQTLPFPTAPATLYEPLRYFLQLGGKRVRPVLCLMGSELYGAIGEDAWHGAAAVEIFHNFTLVHDDIMDKAPLRRGKQTVHEKYGMTAGILGGDALCIYAYDELAQIQQPLQSLLRLFNKTAIEVCEGQQLDMDFETRTDVSVEEYTEMIALKTSVLLACSLKMGALMAGADDTEATKLYEFGRNLGIAFQLQDDYLDAFGAPEKLGKTSGGDIKANKKTYLFLKALETANTEQKHSLLNWFSREDAEGKVTAVLQLFQETGADAQCREAVNRYSERAFDCLREINVSEERKQPLHDLASFLLQRDY